MRVVKNEKGFPAILKDQQECVLAEGFASVLEESNSVEFRSDFVPLYPMGVPMKVVRRFQNQDIHIFWGEVYISDQKLLRLVHVRIFWFRVRKTYIPYWFLCQEPLWTGKK